MLSDMQNIQSDYPYTKDTLRKINTVVQWLKEEDFFEVEVPIAKSRKYYGDFSGLLNEYNVPVILHPFIMRLNGINSSDEHITDIQSIKLINERKIKSVLDYTLE